MTHKTKCAWAAVAIAGLIVATATPAWARGGGGGGGGGRGGGGGGGVVAAVVAAA